MAKPPKPPKRTRVAVPPSALKQHLLRQMRLLENSCAAYDAGDDDEYVRIATAIRVLVHDRGQSQSLLEQLSMKAIPFVSYAEPITGLNLLCDISVVIFRVGPVSKTLPQLDQGPYQPRWVSFDNWWAEDLIRLQDNERLNREQAVLIASNQDGGAHVDPEIDSVFSRVMYDNEAGMMIQMQNGATVPLANIEKATIRHIGFELLQSIRRELEKQVSNAPCHCGSGRKFRYCCGKAMT